MAFFETPSQQAALIQQKFATDANLMANSLANATTNLAAAILHAIEQMSRYRQYQQGKEKAGVLSSTSDQIKNLQKCGKAADQLDKLEKAIHQNASLDLGNVAPSTDAPKTDAPKVTVPQATAPSVARRSFGG